MVTELRLPFEKPPETSPPRYSAKTLLISPQGNVLVLTHTQTGQGDLPGGNANPGETAEQAARREAFEETGYQLGQLTLLSQFDDTLSTGTKKTRVLYAAQISDEFTPTLQPEEHNAFEWISIAELLARRDSGALKPAVIRMLNAIGDDAIKAFAPVAAPKLELAAA